MSVVGFWAKYKNKIVKSLRTRGVAGTVKHAAVTCKVAFRRWDPFDSWYRFLNQRYDRRFGVDTADIPKIPELQSDPRLRFSEGYDATPRSIFFQMLRSIDADFSKFVFIDFGCGKGKVLLLAGEFPFKQIIGIELSSQLIRVTQNNLKNDIRTSQRLDLFQLACMDAGDFEVPHEPSVCYFYNPFKPELMRRVLENIGRSLVAAPRELYIVYFYPARQYLQILLDQAGFLTPVKQTSRYSIYRASGMLSGFAATHQKFSENQKS